MTCFAVCAAMRPKSIGGSGSTTKSPTALSGNSFSPSWADIWVSSFSTASTISVQRESRTSPVLRSIVARMSFSWPYLGAAGFLDGLLHRLEHFLAVDILLPRDGVGDQQQFGASDGGIHDGLVLPGFS